MAIDPTQPLRDELVEHLRKAGGIKTLRVARAFRRVPRHVFVPRQPAHAVYDDRALITKTRAGVGISSSSQPAIMAIMLEQLRLRPGMSVLEIGAGTGYNAALLSDIVGARGRVVSVDIQPDLVAAARTKLKALGHANARLVTGDGARGFARGAPFDRIIVTASCWYLPSAWLHQLTVEGGIIVLPLRLNGTHVSLALRRRADALQCISARQCGFMAMQGSAGRPAIRRLTSGAGALFLQGDARIDVPRLRALLQTPARRLQFESLAQLNPGEMMSFAAFQALQGQPLIAIGPQGGPVESGLCDARATSLCLTGFTALMRGRLVVYGTDEMRQTFEEQLSAWNDAGKPATNSLRVDIKERAGDGFGEMPQPLGNGTYAWSRRGLRFQARYARA